MYLCLRSCKEARVAGGTWERQRNTEHEVQGGGLHHAGPHRLEEFSFAHGPHGLCPNPGGLGAQPLPIPSSSHGRTLKKYTFSQAASHPLSQQGLPAQLPQESCLGVFSG